MYWEAEGLVNVPYWETVTEGLLVNILGDRRIAGECTGRLKGFR